MTKDLTKDPLFGDVYQFYITCQESGNTFVCFPEKAYRQVLDIITATVDLEETVDWESLDSGSIRRICQGVCNLKKDYPEFIEWLMERVGR